MPKSIQTFIVLSKPIPLPREKGATTQEVCVSTTIDYKGGFFRYGGEAGETFVFPVKERKVEYDLLTNMPTRFHEKNAWAAIEEHQTICLEIAKKY